MRIYVTRNEDEDEYKKRKKAEIYVYDEISEYGVDAKSMVEQIRDLGEVDEIDLHVNSPGGLVSDGIAIYNQIKRTNARVTTYVDGLAASIASVIALAGDEVIMAEGSLMMIHDPWTIAMGNAEDLRKEAEILDQHRDTILGIYETNTGLDPITLIDLMAAETWMTGSEALALGFATLVEGEVKVAAWARPDAIAKYKNAPEGVENNFRISEGEEPNENATKGGTNSELPETPPLDRLAVLQRLEATQAVYEKLITIK